MFEVIFATGEQIYTAAVAGAERGYNRSTDDYTKYAALLEQHYRAMLSEVGDRATKRRIQKQTSNSWRKAYLPLSLALVHTHIAFQPSEAHARVFLTSNPSTVFDIPMDYWDEMREQSEQLLG
jgi:hypothetical protein